MVGSFIPFLLVAVDEDASQFPCAAFPDVLQCAEPPQYRPPTAFSTKFGFVSFHYGTVVDYFADCGVAREPLWRTAGRMDRGASEHDDVLLARPKRYVCRILGAIAACSVGMEIANAN